jgi:DinB family protein
MGNMPRKPEEERCPECGYLWLISFDEAVDLIEAAADRYEGLVVAGGDARSAGNSGEWSASGYLWHVVDAIRFGTERLWTLTLDEGTRLPGWNQVDLAAARHYDKLSTVVGLRALRVATRNWVDAAREVPLTAMVEHPEFGTMTAIDSVRRNAHEVDHHARDIERALTASTRPGRSGAPQGGS